LKDFFIEAFWWIIGISLVLTFAAMIFGGIYNFIRDIINFFFKDFINRHLLLRRLNIDSLVFLEQNFKFYNRLNFDDKIMFQRRVQKFIRMKEFIPRGELKEVTIEMKTLVAASAVQITFGLPSIYFEHFDRIILYPDTYYSTITEQYHKGEVNTRGVIVLSWKNLLSGYTDESDGRNLGLHEMAHALKIADSITSEEYDFLDSAVYHEFLKYGRMEMQKIVDGEDSFFRDYAASNDYEFFAVAVENFFERPAEFANYHHELYHLLAELLNQNPLVYADENS
jgi:MtfA peptidase